MSFAWRMMTVLSKPPDQIHHPRPTVVRGATRQGPGDQPGETLRDARGQPRPEAKTGHAPNQTMGLAPAACPRAIQVSQEPTVFLVDDDNALRDAIVDLLERSGYRVAQFPSARRFLDATDATDAGCLILDLDMPGMTGLELQESLLERGYGLPILFLSGLADVRSTVMAMKAGAIDFLEKPIAADLLLRRVGQALAEDRLRRESRQSVDVIRSRFALLTPREREVMMLALQGTSNKDIARTLSISRRTVENHRANVMKKMRAGSFAALCKLAAICQRSDAPEATD